MASKKEDKNATMGQIINDKDKKPETSYLSSREDKLKSLNVTIAQVEKQFGKGSIQKLGSKVGVEYPHISTGIVSFDKATGIGGLPRGRIIEIYGPESAGKTSFCLNLIARAQKSGGLAALVDVEHALDPSFAQKLGVNVDDLIVTQPSSGEDALEITESLIRSNALDVLIVDSVSALIPKAEIEGNFGDSVMGSQARLMSQAMRKLTSAVSNSNTILIFINQIRMKLAVMYGSPECVVPETMVEIEL